MIDDKNKDPTFTYKVPDTVYKVPTTAQHAAELLKMPGLGFGLRGDCFLELLEDGFYIAQALNGYAAQRREELYGNRPSPLGNPEPGENTYSTARSTAKEKFARDFAAAEEGLKRAGRSMAYPNNDEGLWVPLTDE